MFNIAIFVGSLCYGVVYFVLLRKRGKLSDAVIMLLLCGFIAGYNAPYIGKRWPTVEKLYNGLYTPLSRYIFSHLLSFNK